METYEITANAKINLFLRICGKLPNGYHQLYTVMQEVDIFDDITVNIDHSRYADINVICEDMEGLDPKHNLCYKAADRFYARLHNKLVAEGTNETIVFPYTEIILKKRIPSQAGMGGGSSDAAAVLLALQEHFDNPFDDEELNTIAVNIGADVPFFLYGGCCLCEGVGEVVTQLEHAPKCHLVVVKPDQGVSTPRSFAEVDRMELPEFRREDYQELFRKIYEAGDDVDLLDKLIRENEEMFINDLQAPGIEEVPVIRDIIDVLKGAGSTLSLMTGSGSAVFGLFKNEELAQSAKNAVEADGRFSSCEVFVTRMV